MIVIDTSVAVHFFLPGELADHAGKAMQKDPAWTVPRLWRSEFRNVLATRIRLSKTSLQSAIEIISAAENFFQGHEHEVVSLSVLQLSERSRASAYDCEFIALAQQLNVPLVTTDKRLAAAFPETAIALEEWIKND